MSSFISSTVRKAWNIVFSFMVREKYRKQDVRFDAAQTLNRLFWINNH